MRLKLLLLYVFLLVSFFSKSQISYSFSSLTSPYVVNPSPTVYAGSSNLDEGLTTLTLIGFNFTYGCTNYTRFKMSTNGWVTLNNTASTANPGNDLNTTVSARPVLAPLWDNLKTDNTGNLNYQVSGTTPNRVLTLEWKNMKWDNNASGPVISFQVKLYETTNRIEFCYSQNVNPVNCLSLGASIGIQGVNSGDFYSLNNSGASPTASKVFETTSICALPATNQVYRWDPVSCSGAPVVSTPVINPTSNCGLTSVTLTIPSASVTDCGTSFQWQSSTSLGGPYTNVISGGTSATSGTNATYVTTNSVTTYYQCIVACSGFSTTSSIVTNSIITVSPCNICNIHQIASLPYSITGQTTQGEGNELTSANVVNCSGLAGNYYGGEDAVYTFTPTSTGVYTVGLSATSNWVSLSVFDGCPISGGTCLGGSGSGSAASSVSMCVNVTAGTTYYVVLDIWPTPYYDGYDFSVLGPIGCSGSFGAITAAGSPTSGCLPFFTNLSVNSGFSGCNSLGVTYQWQSAPAAVGPFTSISSGTTQSYLANVSAASPFFRCVLSCGATTVASNVVQTAVTATSPAVPCSLSTYTSSSTSYSFETFVGTALPTTDDVLFNSTVFFGFPFCYGGSQYWGGYAASNGAFVLAGVPCYPNVYNGTSNVLAAGGVVTGWYISNPAPVFGTSIPRNAILAPWHDINPASSATTAATRIAYTTIGSAPNRIFIVSYENIPMYSTTCQTITSKNFTSQIKLFETTNDIEIHVGNKQVCPLWNNGQAVMGLHSYDGSIYIPPVNSTAHNAVAPNGPYNQWTMTNTAYKFSSPCASNSGPCAVLPVGFKNFYGENVSDNLNKLTCITSEESDIKEFIVERSTDGIHFSQIGSQVPNNKPSTYFFNDNTFKPNIINYYRITSVENNQQRKSTFVIPIEGRFENFSISEIYPNPASEKFAVSFNSKKENNVTVKVKDMFGRDVIYSDKQITSGIYQVYINCNNLNSGVYLLEVIDDSGKTLSQQKLIISN